MLTIFRDGIEHLKQQIIITDVGLISMVKAVSEGKALVTSLQGQQRLLLHYGEKMQVLSVVLDVLQKEKMKI